MNELMRLKGMPRGHRLMLRLLLKYRGDPEAASVMYGLLTGLGTEAGRAMALEMCTSVRRVGGRWGKVRP